MIARNVEMLQCSLSGEYRRLFPLHGGIATRLHSEVFFDFSDFLPFKLVFRSTIVQSCYLQSHFCRPIGLVHRNELMCNELIECTEVEFNEM